MIQTKRIDPADSTIAEPSVPHPVRRKTPKPKPRVFAVAVILAPIAAFVITSTIGGTPDVMPAFHDGVLHGVIITICSFAAAHAVLRWINECVYRWRMHATGWAAYDAAMHGTP